MPRIAATAVVLVLVAAAIGLNMARYPTVWQMAAPPSQSPQAEETLRPADTSHADRVAPAPSDNVPRPAGETPRRPTMTLPVTTTATSAPPVAAADPQPAGEAAESFVEPLAEYRRQRDANGTAAAPVDQASDAAAPTKTPPPAAPQPPPNMSKDWPAEPAATLRLVATPAPLKTPEAGKKADGRERDSPALPQTNVATVSVPVTGETTERLTPVVRPISASKAPAADRDNPLRPLPPVDPSAAPPPAPLAPGVLTPIYPSTGMR